MNINFHVKSFILSEKTQSTGISNSQSVGTLGIIQLKINNKKDMGSSINCIIPKEVDYSVEQIKKKLKKSFDRLKPEYLYLQENGKFTKNIGENWWISLISAKLNEPEYITGESDSFSIKIYKNIIVVSCLERFSTLYLVEKKMSRDLYKIIVELSKEFSNSDKILIADVVDSVINLAYYNNANFEEICKEMYKNNGTPANTLEELKDKNWYLKT